METDYRNYDRLFVAVKLNKLEELERCYRALGWEREEKRDDKLHRGRVHLVYRRPHRIGNKDKLQLLQVYLEAALNDEGRLDGKSMPLTAVAGILTGLLTLGFAVAGLCLMYLLNNPVIYTAGIVFLACAVAMFLLSITVTLKVFFKEREKRKVRLLRARAEIVSVLKEAARLCTVEGGAGGIEIINEMTEEAAATCPKEADGER
ncbi:MAG: hypothetical protein K2L67_02400 [Clostridia bacterium]|nr:hypothetical protein [Clostridia bacterium]